MSRDYTGRIARVVKFIIIGVMKLFGLIFTLFPMIFLAIGSWLAYEQQVKMQTYLPVSARVISERIESHTSTDSDGHRSTSYKPVIKYEYEVAGRAYTSEEVTTTSLSSSRGWAQGILDRFKPGQQVEAWHDPADPSSAFLLREAMFFPYIFVLFPMIFVCVGTGILFWSGKKSDDAEPQQDASGRYALRPRRGMAGKARVGRFYTFLWWGVGLIAFGHFLWVAEGRLDTVAWVAGPIYFGLGLIPLGSVIYFWKLGRRVDDAILWIDQPAFAPGGDVSVEVEQSVYTGLTIASIELALICEQTTRQRSGSKTTISTSTIYEEKRVLSEGEDLPPLGSVRYAALFTLPADAQPTGDSSYPKHAWSLKLHTDIPNGPDYRAKFPIQVHGASTA